MSAPNDGCTLKNFREMHDLKDNVLNVWVETSRFDLQKIEEIPILDMILVDRDIQVCTK